MLDTLAKDGKIDSKSFTFDIRHTSEKSSLTLGSADKTHATSDFD